HAGTHMFAARDRGNQARGLPNDENARSKNAHDRLRSLARAIGPRLARSKVALSPETPDFRLGPLPGDEAMVVRDCMTCTVETVRPDDDAAVARETFRRRRIRHLPVVAAGRLVGIVSDRDLRGLAEGTCASIDTVMTPAPATATPATPI